MARILRGKFLWCRRPYSFTRDLVTSKLVPCLLTVSKFHFAGLGNISTKESIRDFYPPVDRLPHSYSTSIRYMRRVLVIWTGKFLIHSLGKNFAGCTERNNDFPSCVSMVHLVRMDEFRPFGVPWNSLPRFRIFICYWYQQNHSKTFDVPSRFPQSCIFHYSTMNG